MDLTAPIISYLDKLIAEGEALVATKFKVATSSYTSEDYVPIDPFHRWRGNTRVLEAKLGRAFDPWKGILLQDSYANKLAVVMALLGAIRSVKDAIAGGHLGAVVDLVIAESFSNLIEQADYLLAKGYWLAAGVLARAVLEEELRRLARKAGCFPEKERPTLNDLNSALYKANRYDKLEFKLIDSLAAIGNDCAHNLPGANAERVKYFLDQLAAVLTRLKT